MFDRIFTLLIFQLIISVLIPVYAGAQSAHNPVLIQYGDTRMDRREFELEFEMVMVLKAVESGEPVKSQNQIYLMQQRYLEQRAKEMVLTGLAEQRGITLHDSELDKILDEYMISLGFSGYSIKNMQKLGYADATAIRDYLQRREIIRRLLSDIDIELKSGNNRGVLESEIEALYIASGIRIFPEHLQRTIME